jgi:hypothetical protein
MDNDHILSGDSLKKYVFDRKTHPDESERDLQLKHLKEIKIHNGYRVSDVVSLLKQAGVYDEQMMYIPKASTEPHFFDALKGIIHIINTRGNIRLERDLNQARALEQILGRDIIININHANESLGAEGTRFTARRQFKRFAYELAEDCFCNLDAEKIRVQKKMYVLIGPHSSLQVSKDEIVHSCEDDFLNYRILEKENRQIINLDYIFSDQAINILNQIFAITNDNFVSENMKVCVLHYGKVGLLGTRNGRSIPIGSCTIPDRAYDEADLFNGYGTSFDLHNRFAQDVRLKEYLSDILQDYVPIGPSLNSISVLGQKRSILRYARELGIQEIDMERLGISTLRPGFKTRYPYINDIEFYFAGVGSDSPLDGATLGNTEHPYGSEKKLAQGILSIATELI